MVRRNIAMIYSNNSDLGTSPRAMWIDPFTGQIWSRSQRAFVEQSATSLADTLVSMGSALSISGGFMLRRPDGMPADRICDVLLYKTVLSGFDPVVDANGKQRRGRVLGTGKIVNPETYPHLI